FRLYDRLALRSPAVETETARRAAFAPGGEARLLAGRQRLAEQGIPPDLLARLAKVIAEGDAFAVSHLRPYALADAWNSPRRAVLELCLRATREGLLDLQWDLLCPLCGGAKE